jgi:exodeoxyribonuclease X
MTMFTRLRVIDFETNGLAPPAEVIEVGIADVVIDAELAAVMVESPLSHLCGVSTTVTCETRAVHHIPPADLVGFAPFVAREFWDQAVADGVTAVAAHHADFEGKWLGPALADMPLPLICTYKGALRVFPEAPAHGNQVLRYWFEEQGHPAIPVDLASPAHRAGPDAYVTGHLLAHLLKKATIEELAAWTLEPAVTPKCSIGKWRGRRWEEVDAGFLAWMLRQPDMDKDLQWNAQREMDRRVAAVRR